MLVRRKIEEVQQIIKNNKLKSFYLSLKDSLMPSNKSIDLRKFKGGQHIVAKDDINLNDGFVFYTKFRPDTFTNDNGYARRILAFDESIRPYIGIDSDRLQFTVRNTGGVDQNLYYTTTDKKIYNAVCRYNSTTKLLELYVDGVLRDSLTIDTDMFSYSAVKATVGRAGATIGRYLGMIYEVGVILGTISDADAIALSNGQQIDNNNWAFNYDLTSSVVGKDGVYDYAALGNHGTHYGYCTFDRPTAAFVYDNNDELQLCEIDEPRFVGARRDKSFRISKYLPKKAMYLKKDSTEINLNNAIEVNGVSFWAKPLQANENNVLRGDTGISGHFGIRTAGYWSMYVNSSWNVTTAYAIINSWQKVDYIYVDTGYEVYLNGVFYTKTICDKITIDKIGYNSINSFEGYVDNIIFYSERPTRKEIVESYVTTKDNFVNNKISNKYKLNDENSIILDSVGSNNGTYTDDGTGLPTLIDGVYDSSIQIAADKLQGYLCEKQRQNLLTYSDFSADWSPVRTTITDSGVVGPTGQNAMDLYETIDNGAHYIRRYLFTVSIGTTYSFNFFAKKGNRSKIKWYDQNDSGNGRVYFDFDTGTITDDNTAYGATVKSLPNGWFWFSIPITAAKTEISPAVLFLDDSENETYTGDITKYTRLDGGQLEVGVYGTTPILTTIAPVTRNSETLFYTNIGVDNFNSITLKAAMQGIDLNDYPYIVTLSDGSVANYAGLYARYGNNGITMRIFASGTEIVFKKLENADLKPFYNLHKLGMAWDNVNAYGYIDYKIIEGIDITNSTPVLNTLIIANNAQDSAPGSVSIKDINLYNKKLPIGRLRGYTK